MSQMGRNQAILIDGVEVLPELNRISRNATTIRVAPKIMQLLLYLAERSGQVVSRQELLDRVWQGTHVNEEIVTSAVSQVRKLFGGNAKRSIIETIPKKGYRLVASIGTAKPDPEPGTGLSQTATPDIKTPTRQLPNRRSRSSSRTRKRSWTATGTLIALAAGLLLWARLPPLDLFPHSQSDRAARATGAGALSPLRAKDYYAQGQYHLAHGSYLGNENALMLFVRALSEDPDHAGAHAGLAQAMARRVGEFGYKPEALELAREHANTAISLDPDSEDGHKVLGYLYQIENKPDLARAEYQRAAELAPGDVDAIIRIAQLYSNEGSYSLALSWLSHHPVPLNAKISALLGCIQMQLDNLGAAAEWLQRAVELEPLNGQYAARLTTVRLLRGERNLAAESCLTLLATLPDEEHCILKMGELAYIEGKLARAREYFSKLVQLHPDEPYFQFRLGHTLLRIGNRPEAQYVLEQVEHSQLARRPQRLLWSDHWILAAMYSLKGDEDRAAYWLQRTVASGRLLYRWDAIDPAFEKVRGSPGFERYLISMRARIADLRQQVERSD